VFTTVARRITDPVAQRRPSPNGAPTPRPAAAEPWKSSAVLVAGDLPPLRPVQIRP
jgi:hypothetical protein